MLGLMDQRSARCRRHCQSKARVSRPRQLHQSSLVLGDAAPSYTTTQSQSYSGRSVDGRPLTFHLRDPGFPSQHRTRLDLSVGTEPPPWQSHSADVHGPKPVTPRLDLTMENWARHHSGRAVREITQREDPPEYRTTYQAELSVPVTDSSAEPVSGMSTRWHRHNILTGEQGRPAGPEESSRWRRDALLWAARRWEADCCALRLH